MRGFDPEFVDIIDYILRITRRIWEGKHVSLCLDFYSDDCPVYTLAGLTIGAQEVTDNTLATQSAFPDRKLNAVAVICGGNENDGFHTSHLIHSTMTHLGDNDFGPASGRHAAIYVIAHCIIKDNKIIEEWLVRDNFSLAEQLGFDPHVIAQQKALEPSQVQFDEWREQEMQRVTRDVHTKRFFDSANQSDKYESLIRCTLHNIWNAKMIEDVRKAYADTAKLHASGNREYCGHSEIIDGFKQLIDTFLDLKVSLDYVCSQAFRVEKHDTTSGTHVAARWTLTGHHVGSKLYGKATKAPILILGESHFHIIDEKIHEEWTVFDELSVLTQIYRARLNQ